MAANMKDPRVFFSEATSAQFEYVFSLYDQALKLKAEQKNKNVAEFIKRDKWYNQELPEKIRKRGKDAHLLHEELVQCMKWKLSRGKHSPRIKVLVQMNTPRLCISETKKGFRALTKKDDLASAIAGLCNLKGVGPAMASVMLTAADPTACGFMADECLMAIPEVECIDYTTKELVNFVAHLKAAAVRLNGSGGANWNAHKIEQTLWAHSVLCETAKELLDAMPGGKPATNGVPGASDGEECSRDSLDSTANKENLTSNGNGVSDQDSNTDSTSADGFTAPPCEDTNDSIATSGGQVSEDTNDSISNPPPQQNGSVKTTFTDIQSSDNENTNDSLYVNTNDSLTSISTTKNDITLNDTVSKESLQESSPVVENISSSLKKPLLDDDPVGEEPAAKKAKLEE